MKLNIRANLQNEFHFRKAHINLLQLGHHCTPSDELQASHIGGSMYTSTIYKPPYYNNLILRQRIKYNSIQCLKSKETSSYFKRTVIMIRKLLNTFGQPSRFTNHDNEVAWQFQLIMELPNKYCKSKQPFAINDKVIALIPLI